MPWRLTRDAEVLEKSLRGVGSDGNTDFEVMFSIMNYLFPIAFYLESPAEQ
jgi:hypothetical protein